MCGQAVGHLWIDGAEEARQAAERGLDMTAGAPEPVVEVEMAKGGVEIIPIHQHHHPAAEPDAFGVAGRAVDGLRGFREFVGLVRAILGRVRGRGGAGRRRLAGLILGMHVATLGHRGPNDDQQGKSGDGEVAKKRNLELKQPSTHKIPDSFPARGRLGEVG